MKRGGGPDFPPLLFPGSGGQPMKYRFSSWAFFLLAPALSHAQVASHAPTVFKPAPAPKTALASRQSATARPVARVNGSILTDVDLLREEYAIFPYARQHDGGIPKELAPQIRDGALKMI